jgi:predicted metal-binding membrane protein
MCAFPLAEQDNKLVSGRERKRAPVRWPWLLIALAWAVALLAALTNQRYLIDHHWLIEESGLPWLVAALVFLLCWQVMTLAMMVPSSLPMINLMTYAARKQTRTRVVLAAFLAGYALVWTGFAVAAFVGDTMLHRTVDASPWLADHAFLIGATTFTIAGVFQFSPLKDRCLTACRSPLGFFIRYYQQGVAPALQLGVRHGLFCVGCCWALMLIMFGIGVGSLAWMAGLAGVMVIEKALPGGRRIAPFIGVACLLLAGLWLLHPAWLPVSA